MAEDVFGLVGTTVAGAFQVESVVAEGGFAVVYRAHHSGFRAKVALKCLKIPQYMSPAEQKRFLDQFQAEAELLFKLSAGIPTVVRPLHVDAIRTAGSFVPFMALEWLEGETLDALVKRRSAEGKPPLPLSELIQLLTPVARALERAHNFSGPEGDISIVHRDMKPENVFVARVAGQSVVKILDFGIGKAKSVASQVAGRASQADVGVSSFTPAYGAPEQWVPRRFGQTGPWTDVWGLALTMVELLAGRPIIDGDQAAMMGTTLDPARRPTPRHEGLVVSDAVEAVFERALALDPRDRYPDAGAFWNALLDATRRQRSSRPDPRVEPGSVPPRVERISAPPPTSVSGAYRAVAGAGTSALQPGSLPGDAALGSHNLIPDLETGPPAASSVIAGSAPPVAEDAGRPSGIDLDLAPGEIPSQRPPPRPPSGGTWRAAAIEGAAAEQPETRTAQSSGSWRLEATRQSSGTRPAASPIPARRSSGDWRLQSDPRVPAGLSSGTPMAPATQRSHEQESLWSRLMLPAGLIGLGIAITVVDGAYAAATGRVPSLGPLRPAWLAGGLVVVGIAVLVRRLLVVPDD